MHIQSLVDSGSPPSKLDEFYSAILQLGQTCNDFAISCVSGELLLELAPTAERQSCLMGKLIGTSPRKLGKSWWRSSWDDLALGTWGLAFWKLISHGFVALTGCLT